MAVYVRHLPSTPGALFKGRKRLTWVAVQVRLRSARASVCVCAPCPTPSAPPPPHTHTRARARTQGKFKRPLPLDTVVFGMEWCKPFKNLPAPWWAAPRGVGGPGRGQSW